MFVNNAASRATEVAIEIITTFALEDSVLQRSFRSTRGLNEFPAESTFDSSLPKFELG